MNGDFNAYSSPHVAALTAKPRRGWRGTCNKNGRRQTGYRTCRLRVVHRYHQRRRGRREVQTRSHGDLSLEEAHCKTETLPDRNPP
jgi:hypothetical protein